MQQRRLRRNGGLYFKSGKGAYISSNSESLNKVFCKRNLWWDSSKGRPPRNGQELKMLFENFLLMKIFHLGRPPMRTRSPKKSLYLLIGKVTHHNETLRVFHLGKLPIRIRPPKKSMYSSIGKITHHNESLWVFHLGKDTHEN